MGGHEHLANALAVLLAAGCLSQPRGAVSLTIGHAMAQGEPDMLFVECDTALDNETGTSLFVSTDFYCAFDGLELVIRNDRGAILKQQPYIWHQSRNSARRQYTLQIGRNAKVMRFPIVLANAPSTLRLQLVGALPGSVYSGGVTSQVVGVAVKSFRR